MKRVLLLLALSLCFNSLYSQTTLAKFGLNNNLNPDIDNAGGTLPATISGGAYSTNNCEGTHSLSTNSNNSITVSINTSGYESIKISWEQFKDGSSPKWDLFANNGTNIIAYTNNADAGNSCATVLINLGATFNNNPNTTFTFTAANTNGNKNIHIDNIIITGETIVVANPVLSPSALASFGDVCLGATPINNFTINGSNLTTTPITVGALNGYTYSTTSGGTYSNSLSLTHGAGSYSQTIYMKFTPTAITNYSGSILVSGGGATPVNVAASGNGVSIPSSTITNPNPNGATDVCYAGGGVQELISWDAVPSATAYDVYFGTNPSPALVASNVTVTTYNIGLLSASTTYYWKVVAKNACGSATGVSTFNFTTANAPCNDDYCDVIITEVRSITRVIFADIDNSSSPSTGSASYEDYTSIVGTVYQGETNNPFTVEGFTGGNNTFYYNVYIDWNQNGVFTDAGEAFYSGTITNSTGIDGTQTSTNIVVPNDAHLGNTGMRVISSFEPLDSDPCGDIISGGQIEDYTVNVCALPVAICQPVTLQLGTNGIATLTAAQINNGSTFGCGLASMNISQTNFTCSNVGTNTVTLTITDVNGKVASCEATVTVEDNVLPSVMCTDIEVYLDANGEVTVPAILVDGGNSTDNCGIQSYSLDLNTFTCANLGGNDVILTVTDVNGNSATCTANITVVDNINPTIATLSATSVNTDNSLCTFASSQLTPPSASDNCTVVSVVATPANLTVGSNTVTWTATDSSGLTATSTQQVTVSDNQIPVINGTPANITISTDLGSCDAVVNWTPATVSDNCPGATIVASANSGDTFPLGTTTVTYTASDANGNDAVATSFTVTVNDVTPAQVITQDISIDLDAAGNASIVPADIDNGSNDACGIQSLALDITTFTCANVGDNTVTLTATDNNGNVSSATATVTVNDVTPAQVITQDISIDLDAAGNASIVPADIDNGSNDACGIQSLALDITTFTCANVGDNTVTLTATDNNGNVSTDTATVDVQDNILPIAIAQDVVVELDASGNGSTTAALVNNGSSDACGIASMTIAPSSFTCANVGANTVTLTITDNNGNVSTDTATVDVQDNILPIAIAQDVVVELDASGNGSTTAALVNNGSSDACGIASMTIAPSSFTCANVGANTVTLTITDNNGNVSTDTATVDVQDNILPIAIAQDVVVELDASGNGSTTAALVNNGSSDACGIASMTIAPSSFTCANVGANTVTLTITDNNGNVSTDTATVDVQDNILPIAIAQDVVVELDASGNGSTTAALVNNGSSDACGIASMTIAPSSFTCNEVGANTVTLTITDNNGNVSTDTATVDVQDNILPIAIAQDVVVELDASGNGSTTAALVNNGSSDACGIASMTIAPSSFTCANVGANTVTLTITDNNGNVSTDTATVDVQDNILPIAIAQDVVVELDASGNGSTTAALVNNGSSDACGIASMTIAPSSFTCANVGANTVTLTITDNNGNVSTDTATVDVQDNILPIAIAQDVVVELDASGNGSTTAALVNNGSSDACGIASMTIAPSSFTCANVGANTVTLTITDNNGNVSTDTATVDVQDNILPIAIAQDVVVELDASGNGSTTAALVNNGSSDACGIASMTIAPSSFTCANVGANTVTLTITDNNGNVSTDTATVDVQDNILPIAIAQDVVVELDASGNGSTTAALVNNGSSDACGIASMTIAPSSFTCANVGANTVTLTITDNNGNVSTDTATVDVQDNILPIAIAQDVVVELDASGNGSTTAALVNNGSSDACGIASMTIAPSSFTCANVGANTVTLTITDNNGNVSTDTATVDVQDNILPIAIAQDVVVELDASGNGSTTAALVNNGSSDACGIASMTIAPSSFTCANVGANTVTLTITDNNGNVSTDTATVDVQDNILPIAIAQDVVVELDASGNGSTTAALVNNGSSDACGIASMTIAPSSFTCANVGANTVTLTITDNNGNVSTDTATVDVQDNILPIAIAQDVVVELDASGNGSTTAALVNNGSSDACGIASMTIAPSSFTCANVGANTVTLTITDNNGNVSTDTATVDVQDNILPIAIAQDVVVELDASGNGSTTAALVNNGSSDACGIASMTIAPSSFTCANVGANTVTLTITDNNGNVSTDTATVDVQDNILPIAIAQDVVVELDASGNGSTTAALVNNGSSDACGIASMTIAPSSFTCNEVGANTVTLTITDNNGNVSTDTATVDVQDNILPIAIAQDVVVELDASGNGSTTAALVNNGSSDACGIASMTIAPSSFTCNEVGTNTVTLTITDNNGNVSTDTATVDVQDNILPIAIAQDVVVELDASGNGSTTAALVNNGSSDACGIASMTIAPSSFTCANVGANTVTLTITDNNGNVSTDTATVDVQDNILPIAIAQDVVVELDASGNGSTTAALVNNGSSDACGIASMTIAPSSFTCANVGTNTVTLTITDNNGNVSTDTATVDVQDNILPIAIAQDVVVELDASGNGSTTAALVNNGSSDACGIASMTIAPSSFTCNEVGANTVTLTITDNNGNVSTDTATVDVQDNILPIAIAQDVVVELDASGNGSTTASLVNNGSNDACGIASLVLSQTDFDCSHIGANTVTLTVTDVNGNVSTDTAIVTVEDNVAAVVLTQDITIQLDASGNASIVPGDVNDGSNDACGIQSMSVSPNTFECSDVEGDPVTTSELFISEYIEGSGNNKCIEIYNGTGATINLGSGNYNILVYANGSTSASSNINLTGTVNPGDVYVLCNTGATSTFTDIADQTHGGLSFNGDDAVVFRKSSTILDIIGHVGQDPGTQWNVGGNSTLNKTIVRNSNIIQGVTTSSSGFPELGTEWSVLGEDDASNLGSHSVSGGNLVTLTVTDVNGNVSTATAMVTVEDNVPPVATAQDVTVQLDASGNGSTTAALVNNGSSDACGIASMTIAPSSFTCANVGPNTVTLTITDNNGNVSTDTATVTVEDNVPPVATAQDVTVQLDASGNGSTTAALVNNGSSDACGIASMTIAPSSFTCANVGPNTVTLTITDNNGNVSTATATVTVEDNVPPVATAQDVTVQLDASGNGSITAALVNNGSSDACGIASMSVSPNTFDCSDVTSAPVINDLFISEYIEGSSFNKYIEIYNGTGNDINLSDYQLRLYVNGSSSASTTNTLSGVLTNGSTIVYSNSAATIYGGASTVLSSVNWNGDDAIALWKISANAAIDVFGRIGEDPGSDWNQGGNSTSNQTLVRNSNIISGNIANANGFPSLGTEWTELPQDDVSNLGSHSVSGGGNIVTLTVTDVNGNVSTATATVTVEDNVPPVATAQDVTVQLDASGNGSTTAALVNNGSSDACGIASMTIAPSSFTCANVGPNTVTLTITDNNGNVSTDTATVTVEDNVPPVATAQDVTVQLDASGNGSTTAALVNNGSSDACGIASMTIAPSSFTCANVGPNTVTLTITDNNGNVSTDTATVTVEDNVPPVATAQDVTVQLDASGNGSTTAALVNNGSSDACGIASMTIAPSSFTCANVGPNTVTLTITDNNGNVSTDTATVTVEDNVPPVATAQDVTVSLDANGNGSTTAALVDNGSNDACGIATLVLSQTDFNCSHLGSNTVTLTVTDVNGNVSTATANVEVIDEIAPIIECQDFEVYLDAIGNGGLSTDDIAQFIDDNCGIASIEIAQEDENFNCSDIGGDLDNLIISEYIDGDGYENYIELFNGTGLTVDLTEYSLLVYYDGSSTATEYPLGGSVTDRQPIVIAHPNASFPFPNNSRNLTFDGNDAIALAHNGTVIDLLPVYNSTISLDGTTLIRKETVNSGNISSATGEDGWIQLNGAPDDNLLLHDIIFKDNDHNVLLTVTDTSGNVSTCVANVTIIDNIAPIAIAQDITVQLDATGNVSITADQINDGSNDACGIASLSVDPDTFDCSNVGDNTVTLTVTDSNGNVSTVDATVTVEDNVAPEAYCQDLVIQLDASGNATIAEDAVNNGSTDACGGLTFDTDITTFTCTDVGTNTVTLTVTDINGNSSTCTTTVTVEDNVAPEAICKPVTVTLDANGNASITTADIDNGSNDACGIASLSLDITEFTCSDIDNPVTVELTVIDNNGNVSTCTTTVTVTGIVPDVTITQGILPEFCQGAELVLTANTSEDENDIRSYLWTVVSAGPGVGFSGPVDEKDVRVTGNGTYGVTVTSETNCATYVEYTVTGFDASALLSSYTILAENEVFLHGSNIVQSGGVGVTGANGLIKLHQASNVVDFARATNITLNQGSTVGTPIYSPANITFPDFVYNNLSNNSSPNVTVNNNQSQTLNGSVYGTVTVKQGATVTFSQSNVYIDELKTFDGASIEFSGCTNLYINDKFTLAQNGKINYNSAKNVVMYVNEDVQIEKGAYVRARLHSNGNELLAKGANGNGNGNNSAAPTEMIGMFIAKKVHGSVNVRWNADPLCNPCSVAAPPSQGRLAFSVTAYPNPSKAEFNLKMNTLNTTDKVIIQVFDMSNKQVHVGEFNPEEVYTFGREFEGGVYIVKVVQKDQLLSTRVIKQ